MNKAKIEKVMSEFKHGSLHSGSKEGPEVTKRKQAVAIALSEARKNSRRESEVELKRYIKNHKRRKRR